MSDDFDVSLAAASQRTWDVVIVGAGHNGLVAGLVCARTGLDVLLVERSSTVGGAARTERPFTKAPELPTSTGAYLVGLIQPELLERLDIELPLVRRDPHYFLPTTGSRHLLFGSDEAQLAAQFRRFFSERDYQAWRALSRELVALRDDVAPTWLEPPESIEETAARRVRPELQRTFIELCRGSVGAYLERFGFESPLLRAMYAVTDGYAGSSGSWNTPGTGMNFLIHNLCRLPGSDGTWMLARGGMGSISQAFASALFRAGGKLLRSQPVVSIEREGGRACGVVLELGCAGHLERLRHVHLGRRFERRNHVEVRGRGRVVPHPRAEHERALERGVVVLVLLGAVVVAAAETKQGQQRGRSQDVQGAGRGHCQALRFRYCKSSSIAGCKEGLVIRMGNFFQ
jgi:phytoene dehydrogenase-like protein